MAREQVLVRRTGVLWMLITRGTSPGKPRFSRAADSIPAASVLALVPESQNFSAELESQYD